MTNLLPSSRLHRTVRKLERFSGVEALPALPTSLTGRLLSTECVLGVYRGDTDDGHIVFSDQAVVFADPEDGKIYRVSYKQIATVEFPLPASDSVDLLLHLTSGPRVKLRVVGRQGTFRDVFEVGRFFKRVLEDAANQTNR